MPRHRRGAAATSRDTTPTRSPTFERATPRCGPTDSMPSCWSRTRGVGRFLLLDDFALDVDLDLLAHHELAVQHHVERQAEVPPVDLSFRPVGDPVPHHARVVELAA